MAFDLDGTLIESERRWEEARREVTQATGGRWHENAQREMMGLSTPEWASYMQHELGAQLSHEQIVERVMSALVSSYRRELPLIPGAQAAVRRLAARWPLALASSSPRELIELVLNLSGLADSFQVIVSSAEVSRGKPAPDVYLRACELLASEPKRTVAIEDSPPGVRSAKAAGMPVIMVPGTEFPPNREQLAEADLVLGSIEALSAETVLSLGDERPD